MQVIHISETPNTQSATTSAHPFDALRILDRSRKGYISRNDLLHAIYACGVEVQLTDIRSSLEEIEQTMSEAKRRAAYVSHFDLNRLIPAEEDFRKISFGHTVFELDTWCPEYPEVVQLFVRRGISGDQLRSNIETWFDIRTRRNPLSTLRPNDGLFRISAYNYFWLRFCAMFVPFLSNRHLLKKIVPNYTEYEKQIFQLTLFITRISNVLVFVFELVLVLRLLDVTTNITYQEILANMVVWSFGVATQCAREAVSHGLEYGILKDLRFFRLQASQFYWFRNADRQPVSALRMFFRLLKQNDALALWLSTFTRVPPHVQAFYDNIVSDKQRDGSKQFSSGTIQSRLTNRRKSMVSESLTSPTSPFRTLENLERVLKTTDRYYNVSLSRFTIVPYMYVLFRSMLPVGIAIYGGSPTVFSANSTAIDVICRLCLILFCAVSGLFVSHVIIRDALEKISTMRTIIRNFIRAVDLTDEDEKADPEYGFYIESLDDVEALESLYYCFHDFYRYDAMFQKSVFQIMPIYGLAAVTALIFTSFRKQDYFQPLVVCVSFDAVTCTAMFLWALTGLATTNDLMNDGVADATDKQCRRLRKIAYEQTKVSTSNRSTSNRSTSNLSTLNRSASSRTISSNEQHPLFRTIESLERLSIQIRRREALTMFGLIPITRPTLARVATVICVGLFTTTIRFVFD